ncbi:putative glutamine amidotransferase [Hasllibacter halocynthiae]|uniref:gamma-glutamyl-gamma-aminobutyrate hydrolase n=1 Tax=Hasllibacter halocynthiae TaxID=595589 RepID=A0A2T0X9E9_9RHOB|nr:gamma-glutamyl-gamma-aminobutyrate hydrolase family protein [Hasllibacter halocynthiae]PRY95547.1 putative glutamine amidotransferase [Hasllibacter halocynthiae]
MRPVIGIIGNSYLINDEYTVHAAGTLNCEAVRDAARGVPLIVPAAPCYGTLDEVMVACDGFLFTGGRPNVHPEEYGEAATEAHGAFDRDRDRLALPLIRALARTGQPFLAICRGFQEMAVAFGSTLHPEIRDLPGRDNHRMPPDGTLEEKFALRHDVALTPGGTFARLLGGEVVRTNSLHGQGIDRPGPRVVVEGRAPDGTAEAIRIDRAPGFALGVQWHPEWRAAADPVSAPLFTAFGAACRAWRAGERPAAAA